MRKLSVICMAALLVMAMSCKKEKVENTAGGAGFRATLEAHAGDSKTHLDGLSVKWDAGDAVKVVNADNVVKTFTIGAIHGDYADLVPAEGQEVTDDFYKPNYKAYYPATISDAGLVTLPEEQTYVANSFAVGSNPMAAYAVNKNLDFKNLCGLLALQLTGTCKVKSITITAKGGENLCGEGTLSFDGTGLNMKPTLSALTGDNASSTITLNCHDEVEDTYVQLNSETATKFYFIVPAITLSQGFEVKLTDKDNNVWNRSATAPMTIAMSKILKMETQNVETADPSIPVDGLPGLFSVDSGTKVHFSKGNLHCENGTYKFYTNQYDRQTTFSNTDWGYFGWSTNATNYGMNTSDDNDDYSGSFREWGQNIGDGNTWRTLSRTEWSYLINNHQTSRVTVCGVYGLVIAPDQCLNDYVFNSSKTNYDAQEWAAAQTGGIVFLPAGYRYEDEMHIDDYILYWSSTPDDDDECAFRLLIWSSFSPQVSATDRCRGQSVRLVSNAN